MFTVEEGSCFAPMLEAVPGRTYAGEGTLRGVVVLLGVLVECWFGVETAWAA